MKRILIVEDDTDLQELLQQGLSREGYAVSVASNGKEAVAALTLRDGDRPDLVVLDVRMPNMDGIETMGHILKLKHETPVIIHTAYLSYQHDALIAAADAYVIKSHDLTKLKNKIFDLIGK